MNMITDVHIKLNNIAYYSINMSYSTSHPLTSFNLYATPNIYLFFFKEVNIIIITLSNFLKSL